jgi:hypothetical protein
MAVFATITAIVAAVGAGFAFAVGGATFSWTAAAIAFGASMVLSVASHLLAPKPSKAGFTSYGDGDFTRQFRQPTPERNYVYGETRVSGAIAFIGSTNDNKYLHMVVILADHEIQEIGEIIINEESVTADNINGSGIITSGKYADKVRIKKYLGTATQNADSDLINEVSDWTVNHRLQGIAYVYVRFEFDRNIFTSGIPNVSAWIKGKKILDSRDNTVRYSTNIALIAKDYLTDSKVGFGVLESELA